MYNIIILIIATDKPNYYLQMSNIWKKYMNTHPQIKSYFIKGKIKNQSDDIYIDEENFTIHSNIDDSLIPGILIKTLKSINYIMQNFDFKYIYRTNLSSFLNLPMLNNYAEKNNFNYGAIIGNYQGIQYASGCGFFISKETCKYLLENQHLLNYNLYDDVAIGQLLVPIKNIFTVPRIDIVNINNEKHKIDKNIFHYRCKNSSNMYETVNNLNYLYSYLY